MPFDINCVLRAYFLTFADTLFVGSSAKRSWLTGITCHSIFLSVILPVCHTLCQPLSDRCVLWHTSVLIDIRNFGWNFGFPHIRYKWYTLRGILNWNWLKKNTQLLNKEITIKARDYYCTVTVHVQQNAWHRNSSGADVGISWKELFHLHTYSLTGLAYGAVYSVLNITSCGLAGL